MTSPAPGSIASSPWRLADAQVHVVVDSAPTGLAPRTTTVAGGQACVAFTDPGRAQAAASATSTVHSIGVAELLGQLPPGVGLLLDPGSAAPVHVPAGSRTALIDAARPFPPHAPVMLAEPVEEPTALLDAVRAAAPDLPPLRRLWGAWYTVADAAGKLLVVYDVEPVEGADAAAVDLVVRAAETVEHPQPVLVVALPDVPEQHRQWLLAGPARFWPPAGGGGATAPRGGRTGSGTR